jgi:hypothetical protein
MAATRTSLKCPHCGFDGYDGDPHTCMTRSRRGQGFRCTACGQLFSIAIRLPGQRPRRQAAKPKGKLAALVGHFLRSSRA